MNHLGTPTPYRYAASSISGISKLRPYGPSAYVPYGRPYMYSNVHPYVSGKGLAGLEEAKLLSSSYLAKVSESESGPQARHLTVFGRPEMSEKGVRTLPFSKDPKSATAPRFLIFFSCEAFR